MPNNPCAESCELSDPKWMHPIFNDFESRRIVCTSEIGGEVRSIFSMMVLTKLFVEQAKSIW